MKNLFSKIWNKEEGFTLIELIIVIAILAIIAAIAIPNVLSAVDNSRKSTDVSNGQNIANAAATLRAQRDAYAGDSGVINVTSGAEGAGITAGYADDIIAQLNGVAVSPKYLGADVGGGTSPSHLVVSIAANGVIEVYATAANTASTANGLLLYPTPDTQYDAN